MLQKDSFAGSIARKLLARLRRARVYARWLWHEVPRNPGYELYARREGTRNYSAFMAARNAGPDTIQARMAPFGASAIPRIIWIYWRQSEAQAPFLVQRCIESWRQRNPGWDVRVLDEELAKTHVDLADIPQVLPTRFFANLLRIRLLTRYGGVWTDATVYCHRPLDDWAPLASITGFFAFRYPSPGSWFDTWFLIAERDHLLLREWEAAYTRYIRQLTHKPDMYFVFSYVFQWQLKRNPEAMAAWLRAGSLPAQPAFFMMEVLKDRLDVARLHAVLAQGFPVSKLNWRAEIDEAGFGAFCDRLEEPRPHSAKRPELP